MENLSTNGILSERRRPLRHFTEDQQVTRYLLFQNTPHLQSDNKISFKAFMPQWPAALPLFIYRSGLRRSHYLYAAVACGAPIFYMPQWPAALPLFICHSGLRRSHYFYAAVACGAPIIYMPQWPAALLLFICRSGLRRSHYLYTAVPAALPLFICRSGLRRPTLLHWIQSGNVPGRNNLKFFLSFLLLPAPSIPTFIVTST